MRNRKHGRKPRRTPAQRHVMNQDLVTSLFNDGRVITTDTKAREARHFAEKLITLARDGSQQARGRAVSLLPDEHVIDDLFSEIGPRYKDRQGGYSRILWLNRPRQGKYAPRVLLELVEVEMESVETAVPAASTTAAKAEESPHETPTEDEGEPTRM